MHGMTQPRSAERFLQRARAHSVADKAAHRLPDLIQCLQRLDAAYERLKWGQLAAKASRVVHGEAIPGDRCGYTRPGALAGRLPLRARPPPRHARPYHPARRGIRRPHEPRARSPSRVPGARLLLAPPDTRPDRSRLPLADPRPAWLWSQ